MLDNPLQVLGEVYELTNTRIWLKPFEEVKGYQHRGDQIILVINRAVSEPYRRDFRVTKRGFTIYQWDLAECGYQLTQTVTQWWSTNEVYTSAVARVRDTEWESLCHRPGNEMWPMDSEARKAQGY